MTMKFDEKLGIMIFYPINLIEDIQDSRYCGICYEWPNDLIALTSDKDSPGVEICKKCLHVCIGILERKEKKLKEKEEWDALEKNLEKNNDSKN